MKNGEREKVKVEDKDYLGLGGVLVTYFPDNAYKKSYVKNIREFLQLIGR